MNVPRSMKRGTYYEHTRHVGPVRGCPLCPSRFNDPPPDSLFELVPPDRQPGSPHEFEDHENCRCTVCGEIVENSTEGRDAHLNEKGCHVA